MKLPMTGKMNFVDKGIIRLEDKVIYMFNIKEFGVQYERC